MSKPGTLSPKNSVPCCIIPFDVPVVFFATLEPSDKILVSLPLNNLPKPLFLKPSKEYELGPPVAPSAPPKYLAPLPNA